MAVAYEELAGSPTLVLDRDGGSAQRVVKIAWNQVKAFGLEVFPAGNLGFPLTASFPGFPWLRAQSMKVEPWNPEKPDGNGGTINTYTVGGAKVTIDYAPNKTEDGEKGDNPGDADGADEIIFLENEINFGGEYLVWPNQGVRWESKPDLNADGSISVVACEGQNGVVLSPSYKKDVQVSEEIRVGIIIPTIEHSMTWNRVLQVPWNGIRTTLGKVNKLKWAGALPETMLFIGCQASRQTSNQGAKLWKLNYKFHEKCINFPINEKKKEVPIGWNHFFRPLGAKSRWDRLLYGPECRTIYQSADFGRLFRGN